MLFGKRKEKAHIRISGAKFFGEMSSVLDPEFVYKMKGGDTGWMNSSDVRIVHDTNEVVVRLSAKVYPDDGINDKRMSVFIRAHDTLLDEGGVYYTLVFATKFAPVRQRMEHTGSGLYLHEDDGNYEYWSTISGYTYREG